jgi:hypothetical protein
MGLTGMNIGVGVGGHLIVGIAIDWKRLNHEGHKEKVVKRRENGVSKDNWKYSGGQLSQARAPANPQIL